MSLSKLNMSLNLLQATLEAHYVCFIKGTNIKVLYKDRLTKELARVQYDSHDIMFPVHLLTLEPEYDSTPPSGAKHQEEWNWVPAKGLNPKPDNDDRIQFTVKKGMVKQKHRRFKNDGDPVEIGDYCYVMGLPFLKVKVVQEDPRSLHRYKIELLSDVRFKTGWYRVSKNALRRTQTMRWAVQRCGFYNDYFYPELNHLNNRHYRITDGAYIAGSNIKVVSVLQRYVNNVLVVLQDLQVPIWVDMHYIYKEPFQIPVCNDVSVIGSHPLYIMGIERLGVKVVHGTGVKRKKNLVTVTMLEGLSPSCKSAFGTEKTFSVRAEVLFEAPIMRKRMTRRQVFHSIGDLKLMGWEDSHLKRRVNNRTVDLSKYSLFL